MRLALIGQLVETTEAGLRMHCPSKQNFDDFFQGVKNVRVKFDNLLRLLCPLPGNCLPNINSVV